MQDTKFGELLELVCYKMKIKTSTSSLQCFRETLPGQEAVLQGALADGGPGHPLGGELGAVPVQFQTYAVTTAHAWPLPRPPALVIHHDDAPRPAHPLVHVAQRLAGRLGRAQAAAEAGRDGVGQHHLGDALPVPRGRHLTVVSQ